MYFTEIQDVIVLLLLGGNKTFQKRDIKAAQKMLKHMKQEQAKKRPTKRRPVEQNRRPRRRQNQKGESNEQPQHRLSAGWA